MRPKENLAKAALGKKPPMTGTAPVVKPVTPRVPPTLQGAAVPARTAISENVLNATVERKIMAQTLTEQMISSLGLDERDLRTNGFIKILPLAEAARTGKILPEQLVDYVILTRPSKVFDTNNLRRLKNTNISLVWKEQVDAEDFSWFLFDGYRSITPKRAEQVESMKLTDFSKLITQDTPKFVPIDFKTNIIEEAEKYPVPWSKQYGFKAKGIDFIIVITKIDKALFVEKNGQVFIDTEALTHIRSYGEALLKLKKATIGEIYYGTRYLGPAIKRDRLIIDALTHNQSKGINSLEEIKTQVKMPTQPSTKKMTSDITTQRTAEEIKSLVENLDPQNPLRKSIEGTLEQNGYLK